MSGQCYQGSLVSAAVKVTCSNSRLLLTVQVFLLSVGPLSSVAWPPLRLSPWELLALERLLENRSMWISDQNKFRFQCSLNVVMEHLLYSYTFINVLKYFTLSVNTIIMQTYLRDKWYTDPWPGLFAPCFFLCPWTYDSISGRQANNTILIFPLFTAATRASVF